MNPTWHDTTPPRAARPHFDPHPGEAGGDAVAAPGGLSPLFKAALGEIGVPILLCDGDFRIFFLNEASAQLLQRIEPEARQHIAGFAADRVLGMSLDLLVRGTGPARRLFDPRGLPLQLDVPIGPLVLDLHVRGLYGDGGEHLGCVVEWREVSAVRRSDHEVQRLLSAGQGGRLGERADTVALGGLGRGFCEGLNRLLDAVSAPIQEVTQVMERLAQGDLCAEVRGEYQNDLRALKDNFNRTVSHLSRLVSSIRATAESVTAAAHEIRTGVGDLALRTEEQAASLEQTASAMEEMTASVRQNADSAKQANLLAVSSREVAEKGGTVVRHTVLAMEEINKSSKKIADIINVIDEIAFQTNLLALNAAVEAARAGEQGRGFAVVAAEVRNLAQRSATAAKEIKTLIRDSVQKIQDGSHLVEESGRHLEDIVSSVKRVTEIVSAISSASQEQSTGIAEVNTAVTQMDRFTQQNAALVEETANAATVMEEQAMEMQRLVDSFKLPAELQQPARPQPVAETRARHREPPRAQREAPLRSTRTTGRAAPQPRRAGATALPTRTVRAPAPAPAPADEEGFEEF